MKLDRVKLKAYIHKMVRSEWDSLAPAGIDLLLDRGRQFKLSNVLQGGGAILFPHAGLADCGHQIAAAVHAALDSGAEKVVAIGVLHALSDELEEARVRVAYGSDPQNEASWGIQGPGLSGREDWRDEFSLFHFQRLWDTEIRRRKIKGPELILRYPYLAGGKPEKLPGIEDLKGLVQNAVVLTTADAFHHGIGYGEPPESALAPDERGLALARKTINEGLALLNAGEYWKFNQHCVLAKSDGRDAGQVARYLLGPLRGEIVDLTFTDTTKMYDAPPPTWVAAALIALHQS